MANIANIQKLNYCGCRLSNTGTCSNIATYCVSLCKKGTDTSKVIFSHAYDYRCEAHKNKGTVSTKVFQIDAYDQSATKQMIDNFLKTLIGKNIVSNIHTARELEVKYLKNNCGVMCYQNHSKKWKFVYYNNITEIL